MAQVEHLRDLRSSQVDYDDGGHEQQRHAYCVRRAFSVIYERFLISWKQGDEVMVWLAR